MSASLSEMPSMIPPSPWVVRHAQSIPARGKVLDLACGSGRHARFLAGLGYPVLAVDRDAGALAGLSAIEGITTRQLDLEGEEWPLAGQVFDGIVVTNYLWRPRLPDLLALLAPGGVLIYETFMVGNEAYGKPSRAEFLLQPGELKAVAEQGGLQVLDFCEGYVDQPKPAMRQAVCALRP